MAQINLRVDDDVKKNAEQVCAEIGISMAAAINIYLKKLGREHRIPFEVSADPFYSEANMRYLENLLRDVQNGKAHFAEHELTEVD